jgi:hypothetical protein
MQPKLQENILGNPSIINMVRQTCFRQACKDWLEIDVVRRPDARQLIEIKSSLLMVRKWLFDTGAVLVCPPNHSGLYKSRKAV